MTLDLKRPMMNDDTADRVTSRDEMTIEDVQIKLPFGEFGGIFVAENGMPADICRSMISLADKYSDILSQDTRNDGSPNSNYSRNLHIAQQDPRIDAVDAEELARINRSVFDVAGNLIELYSQTYADLDFFWSERYDTGYVYKCYPKGSGYKMSGSDGGVFRDYPVRERVFSFIVFLNSASDGSGISFDFHDWTCEAVEGRVLAYPANFHYPTSITSPASADLHIIQSFTYAPAEGRQVIRGEEPKRAL